MRLLALLFLAGFSAWAQAISTPGASTQNPNQVSVSTSYLYYNKMHYAGTWSSTATYSLQDVVLYSGSGYISLGIGNLNNLPSSLGLWWVAIPGSAGGSSVWGGITGTLSAQTDLAAALTAKEPSITAGTTAQYWRGDKTWQNFAAAVWAQLSGTTPISFNVLTGAISCPSCVTSNLVTSVFGRTGAVVATSGDYLAAQVTNAVDSTGSYSNPSWLTALAWAKITGAPAFAANTGAVSHQFFTAYNSTTGAFLAAQPAFTDISGSLAHSQLPTLLSGDIPNNAANTSGNAATATALAGTPSLCSTGQAPTGILASGNATGCASTGGTVTDSNPVRYYTATHYLGNADYMASAGWITNMTCCSPTQMNGGAGTAPYIDGMLMGNTGSIYVQLFVRVPTGWTGAVTVGAWWTLSVGGTAGTGSHAYALGCFVPGSSNLSTAITFSAASNVAFTNTGSAFTNVGQVDSVTPAVPTCAAGNILAIRMTRTVTGTDTNGTVVAYFDVALPHTVQ